jgi:hypothetical protein
MGRIKKQWWLNACLLLIVVLLIVFLVYSSEQSKRDVSQQRRLFQTTLQEAQRIVIERQGQESIVLARKQQHWLLVKPAVAPVNEQRIRHLLTILDESIQGELARREGDLKSFKLDVAQIKLTVNNEKITFGMINPITNNRYVLKNTNIYTIKEIVYGTLGSSVTPLLQHRLLPDNMIVTQLEAPASFYHTAQAQETWGILEASNIADYIGNETILGIVSLTIQNKNNKQHHEKPALTTLVLDILAIKPTLIVGRADLNVKYTIDKIATERLLAH